MWRGSAEASPPQPAPPCLQKTQTWATMTTIWKAMWMRRWKRFFPSTCSLERAPALVPPLSLPPVVVPVPPPPTENPQPLAGPAAGANPPDHHKGLPLTSSLVPLHLKPWSPNAHLPLVPMLPQQDQHPLNAHHHLQDQKALLFLGQMVQVVVKQQQELLDLEVFLDRISLLELG